MTYAGEVIFGSTRITLDGIVYSATHPVALINGMVISEGMAIGDYTVEKIEPSRVKFRGPKESFYIRVR